MHIYTTVFYQSFETIKYFENFLCAFKKNVSEKSCIYFFIQGECKFFSKLFINFQNSKFKNLKIKKKLPTYIRNVN